MLSDSERRRLAEIESSLRADEPVFVQHFDTEPRPRLRRTALALLAFIIAVTITLIALVRGNVLAAVVGLTAAGVSVGLWATFRKA
jgi:small-conductance mechanosensitive channel